MIEIFHVSDLHFGKSKRRRENAESLLKKLKKKYDFERGGNRYLVVTGDIVHNGEKDEYNAAKNALLPFKEKVFVVPGNHDYGWMGADYSEKAAKLFDSDLASKLDITHPFFPKTPFLKEIVNDGQGNKVLLIGLNSCSKKGLENLAEGEIEDFQRKALDQILNNPENKGIPKIVFLHHIPHRRAKGIWMSLTDWKELMAIVRGRVDALAFGHEGKMWGVEQQAIEQLKVEKKEIERLLKLRESDLIREMKLRSGRGQKIRYYLDANSSVREQAYYRIRIEDSKVSARLMRFA